MKKVVDFDWTKECQQAFDALKDYLSSSPVLSKTEKGEVLYVSLVVVDRAMSSVLLREDDENA